MQIRVARPTNDLARAVEFYRDLVGLAVLSEFRDHDGFSGAIFGLPDASCQLELVSHRGATPAPTSEDQLVLYLGSLAEVATVAGRLAAAGFPPREPARLDEGRSAVLRRPGWLLARALALVLVDDFDPACSRASTRVGLREAGSRSARPPARVRQARESEPVATGPLGSAGVLKATAIAGAAG